MERGQLRGLLAALFRSTLVCSPELGASISCALVAQRLLGWGSVRSVTVPAVGRVVLCGDRPSQGSAARPGHVLAAGTGAGVGREPVGSWGLWRPSQKVGGCSALSLARDGHCGSGRCLEQLQDSGKLYGLLSRGK